MDEARFILATVRAAKDGAIYDHNPVVETVGDKVAVVACRNQFLAEYQLGRLRSMLGWSASHQVYSTLEDAHSAAESAIRDGWV